MGLKIRKVFIWVHINFFKANLGYEHLELRGETSGKGRKYLEETF